MISLLCSRMMLAAFLLVLMQAVYASPAKGQLTAFAENDRYSLSVRAADGAVVVALRDGTVRAFTPDFKVLYAEKDPQLAKKPAGYEKVNYVVPTWFVGEGVTDGGLRTLDTTVVGGEGLAAGSEAGDIEGRTADLYQAAARASLTAESTKVVGETVVWKMTHKGLVALTATVSLPAGSAEPVLSFETKVLRDGWFSVGYCGAPSVASSEIDEIFQPLIWNYKRFPERSYLTQSYRCPIPGAFVAHEGVTVSVIGDPAYLPFDPLPVWKNAQFGVSVRSIDGKAQPAIFAPVLGGMGSKIKAGKRLSFKAHLLVSTGTVDVAFEHAARNLFRVTDYRQNNLASLNTTLDNMIDYGMSEYSRFNEHLRGCSYATDVPGAVKNVSALHPLSLAMVTDSREIYAHRARPIMEYMMSREKFLFAVSPDVKIQNPSWLLRGPCAPLTEIAALHAMTQQRNPHFLAAAKELRKVDRVLNLDTPAIGDSFQNNLALYEVSGERAYLDRAVKQADAYLQTEFDRPMDFDRRPGMFFWVGFVPSFHDLLTLYEATGEKRFLDAAHRAARDYAQYLWQGPVIPDGSITVHPKGKAPHYWYLKGKGHAQMKVPKETVPAWRLSEVGLISESSGTSHGHRGIFMTNHAPWFLRIGQLTGDRFLHDMGRSAMIGRYTNFPGYHMNTGRTTVYEKPDYPLREHKALGYNSMHYNHPWPMASMVLDYLVSDTYAKSEGAIDFPSRYAEGYAYLRSKVYGDRPGKAYDVEDLWLWMPKGLVDTGHIELNYIAARGDGVILVTLTNQSDQTVRSKVSLSNDRLTIGNDAPVRVWRDNKLVEPTTYSTAGVEVEVSPGGITVLEIGSATVKPAFQRQVKEGQGAAWKQGTADLDFGGTHGMILSMGDDLTSAYVYTQATFRVLSKVVFHYNDGSGWKQVVDESYPYEFTAELPKGAEQFEYYLEATRVNGKVEKTDTARMQR